MPKPDPTVPSHPAKSKRVNDQDVNTTRRVVHIDSETSGNVLMG
jgi:hypothetical protein